MIGGGRQRRQDAHRPIVATATRGGQQIAQLADRGLKEHGRQVLVFLNVRTRPDGRSGSGPHQLHRRDREHVAGDHPRGHRRRNRLGVFGFQVDVNVVGPAVFSGHDAVHHADQNAVILHVRFLRQAVAHVDQIGDDPHIVVEPACRFVEQADRQQGRDEDDGDTTAEQLTIGGAAPVDVEGISFHLGQSQPPNLAPASTPHSAIVSSILTMIMTVMLARMPCPAATPTPSGPPLA